MTASIPTSTTASGPHGRTAATLLTLAAAVVALVATPTHAGTITHVPGYTFLGDSLGDRFGFSVSDAGDVNGDGVPDLIVGAAGNLSGNEYARVFSGFDGSTLHTFNTASSPSAFGYSVSGAGDVNGDGRADRIRGVASILPSCDRDEVCRPGTIGRSAFDLPVRLR